MGYSGPLDATYANPCEASKAAGGSPVITVDVATHLVELWFTPPQPAGLCPDLWNPVAGLEGSFGPLSELGPWRFIGENGVAGFTVSFVAGLSGEVSWYPGIRPPLAWQLLTTAPPTG